MLKTKQIQVVLVNKDDKVVGFKEKMAAHHNLVSLHRAISVVILDKTGKKILLQRRNENKPTWGGYWSNACCTHPFRGESYLKAAKRRLFEELGIKTSLKEVLVFIYQSQFNEIWGEHELDHVFVGRYEGPIKINQDEVMEAKWFAVKKVAEEIKQKPNLYTPWFKLILEKLVFSN